MIDQTTLYVIGAAIALLALVLAVLALTGRKPHEGPAIDRDDPSGQILPEPEAAPALPTTDLLFEPAIVPEIVIAAGPPDQLTRMKGLGPKAAGLLGDMGYTRYDQIAAWSDADIARIDAGMGAFAGRIARDRWVEQARFLADDDIAGFEARFGKLG